MTGRSVARALRWVGGGPVPTPITYFVLGNAALQWGVLALVAPNMLGVIRADRGAPAEYLMYLWYNAALLLGVAWAAVMVFTVARRLASETTARWLLVAGETAVWIALAADVLTFTILGLHPYGRTTWAAVGTADVRVLPWWFLAGVGIVALGVWLTQLALFRLSHASWRRADDIAHGERRIGGRCLGYALLGLAAFVALDRDDAERLVPRGALPLYSVWMAPGRPLPDLRPARALSRIESYPTLARRPDILFVLVESLRWDVFTPDVMPSLTKVAAERNCLVAPRHYAGGHLTQYGAFALLYGLGAWAFLPYMQAAQPSWPLAVLKANGYELHGLDATGVLSYGIDPLVPEQFDRYETLLMQDSVLVDRTVGLLTDTGRPPRFVFTFLYSPHAPYLSPKGFEPAWPAAAATRGKQLGWGRYLRSVRYVDHLVGSALAGLGDRIADGDLVVAFTGDHGEEFWEFGVGGHAAVRFHDVRTRVPLFLCLGGTAAAPHLSENADVFPTILDWAGVRPLGPPVLSGHSFLALTPGGPVGLAGSGFPERDGRFALVTPHAKFWLTLEDREFRDIRLDRVTDLADSSIAMADQLRGALASALERFRQRVYAALEPH